MCVCVYDGGSPLTPVPEFPSMDVGMGSRCKKINIFAKIRFD